MHQHVQKERYLLAARGDCLRGLGGGAVEDPESATSPERPKRQTFTAEYQLRIVREADKSLALGYHLPMRQHDSLTRVSPPSGWELLAPGSLSLQLDELSCS